MFRPTTLPRALDRLGFVQADPIRSPARAQDLILRQRVLPRRRSGRRYAALDVEEDVFINYGFVTPRLQALMHPRAASALFGRPHAQSKELLAFVQDRGSPSARRRRPLRARPRHQLLGRIVERDDAPPRPAALSRCAARRRRETGIRLASHEHGIRRRPAPSARRGSTRWSTSSSPLRAAAAPEPAVRGRPPALRRSAVARRPEAGLTRAKARLAHARIDGVDCTGRRASGRARAVDDRVRLLAPIPSWQDRRRFELFWGWPYRFEAHAPLAKRKARLLRAADAVARSRRRLGQPVGARRVLQHEARLRRAPADASFATGSTPSSIAFATFWVYGHRQREVLSCGAPRSPSRTRAGPL